MFEHEIDVERKLIVVRVHGSGPSASETAAESAGEILAHPDVDPEFSMMVVIDPRASAPDDEEVSRIGNLMRFLGSELKGRIAVVVTGVGHATPAHLISNISGATEVFQDERAAMRWIGGASAREPSAEAGEVPGTEYGERPE